MKLGLLLYIRRIILRWGKNLIFRLPESNIGFDANKDIEEWFFIERQKNFSAS